MEAAAKIEGYISLGPWGCERSGEPWSYLPNGHINQVIIRYGRVISSVLFQSINHGTGLVEYSKKFGGSGGYKTDKVCIDSPLEQLTSIDLEMRKIIYAETDTPAETVITSITFHSNVSKYGPFGDRPFGDRSEITVSNPMDGGVIVGLHGRAGRDHLNSMGIYVVPKRYYLSPITDGPGRVGFMKLALPREIGPWGISGGKRWDDGVFTRIQQVCFYVSIFTKELRGIQFEYEKADRSLVWSPLHGRNDDSSETLISLHGSSPSEECVGIEGYSGQFKNDKYPDGIRSITLYTNKGKYGPFGVEYGTHFMSSLTAGGKIVGFWGASGACLSAIGIHVSYI